MTKTLYVVYSKKSPYQHFICTSLPVAFVKKEELFICGDEVIEGAFAYELLSNSIRVECEKYDTEKAITDWKYKNDKKEIQYLRQCLEELKKGLAYELEELYYDYDLDKIEEMIDNKEQRIEDEYYA